MSNDLQEAMERWNNTDGFGSSDPLDCVHDLHTLAAAWIAEHPADDEEPVTEEWLRAVGFKEWDGDLGIFHDGYVLGICQDWSCMIYQHAATPDEHAAALPGCYKTRGDVRRLARALGVTLKEKA